MHMRIHSYIWGGATSRRVGFDFFAAAVEFGLQGLGVLAC